MALSNASSTLSSKSLHATTHTLVSKTHQPSFALHPTNTTKPRSLVQPITAVHAAEPDKNSVAVKESSSSPAAASGKWALESWKTKKALQLPEYPDKAQVETVLKTLEDFPPLVFAGEARSLEERLAEAAMGNAFLLQGGDCAESFKEFNANTIRDTFRVLLQMGVVLMFGGQMPIIKVRLSFAKKWFLIIIRDTFRVL